MNFLPISLKLKVESQIQDFPWKRFHDRDLVSTFFKLIGFFKKRILSQSWRLSKLSQTKIENHSLIPTHPTHTFAYTMELEVSFSWRMGHIPEIDQQFLGDYLWVLLILSASSLNTLPYVLNKKVIIKSHDPMTHSQDSLTEATAWAESTLEDLT